MFLLFYNGKFITHEIQSEFLRQKTRMVSVTLYYLGWIVFGKENRVREITHTFNFIGDIIP